MSQLQVTGEAKIRDLQGPVVANSGVISALDGAASQYVRGDGTLADFPTQTGGGSSVSYYLNGSVNQGIFGGSTYYQMSRTAIIGTGTNFSTSANGLLAQFITDANDPDATSVPSGNWNIEFYLNVSASSGATASFYAEFYKYDGTTFTLLASNVATPEYLTGTTTIDAYFTSVAFPESALATTDRLAIRIYANVASKTVTLYTQDNRLAQIVTTFSKGILSLNNLTDQQQYFAVGTSGSDFNIASSVDIHTFNFPLSSASNTGKLSSTDWSTFNNKQNALTNPITGTGASGNVAYFNGTTSLTSEAAFNYDASTNRLGVNTSTPNATIGANAATDAGYSLLLKNDNANYNGIGFGTDSTYGNLIATEKLGTALTRNLTLLNQSGFISLTETGNLGLGLLTPNTGLDIYNGSNAYLWLHNAASGVTGTDGVRLALFSTKSANLRNFDGALSITAEGDFSVITLGAENIRVNSADGKVGIGNPTTVSEMLTVNGSIQQSVVLSALLKTNASGKIIAAVANTDYQLPINLTTTGSTGAATFVSNTLNIPNYTLSGLGGVPSSRTLTINGTAYDLSADRSWTVGTMTGSGTSGQVPYFNGSTSLTSEAAFNYDASLNRLGVNTGNPNATIGADAALDNGFGLLIKTGASNYNGIGLSIDSTYGNLISTEKLGTAVSRNLTLLNQSGFASLKESGSFGINTLNPAVAGVGIDIYSSTSAGLRLHTATSGTTVSDGAGINFSAANNLGITNYEAGAIDIVTNGNSGVYIASNGYVGINGATPSVALTVTGAGLFSTSLSVAGLTTGQIIFPTSGGTLAGSSNLFWDNTNGRLSIGASTNANRRLTVYSSSDAEHLALISNVPAITFGSDNSYTYYSGIGMATAANNFVTGTVAGDLTLGAFYANKIILFNSNTNTQRMNLNGDGAVIFSGSVTGRGGKSQIVVDGNSVGCGISLTNTIVGANRRNWGIFTEDNVDGDFVIKRSTTSGGAANTAVLSILNTGAATFSSSVQVNGASAINDLNVYNVNNAGITLQTSFTGTTGNDGFYMGQLFQSTNFLFRQRENADIVFETNNGSERMRILSNGNVLIGATTDPSVKLQVVQSTSGEWTGDFKNYSSGAYGLRVDLSGSTGSAANSAFQVYTQTGGGLRFTNNTQLFIGTSADAYGRGAKLEVNGGETVLIRGYGSAYGIGLFMVPNPSATGTHVAINFRSPSNTEVGSITTNGSTTSYNITSDYRLKEDLKEIDGLDKLSKIKVYDFKWKGINERMDGVLAHELQETLPYAVHGEKDAINEDGSIKTQGVDYSKIVPILIKSIQELEARIKQLENK